MFQLKTEVTSYFNGEQWHSCTIHISMVAAMLVIQMNKYTWHETLETKLLSKALMNNVPFTTKLVFEISNTRDHRPLSSQL